MAAARDSEVPVSPELGRLSSLLDTVERRLWFIDTFCDSLVDPRFRAAWRADYELERERVLSYQDRLAELDHHARKRIRTLRSEGLEGSSLALKMELAAAAFDTPVSGRETSPAVTLGQVLGVSYSAELALFRLEDEPQVRSRWADLSNTIVGLPRRVANALRESGDMMDSVVDSALDVVPGGAAIKEAVKLGSAILSKGAV